VTVPTNKREFCGAFEPTAEFEPFVLGRADALTLAKETKVGKQEQPLAFKVEDQQLNGELRREVKAAVQLGNRVTNCELLKGNFPDYKRLIPKRDGFQAAVTLNPDLLGAILKQFSDFHKDRRMVTCATIYFKDNNSPIMIRSTRDDQEMESVVMPMRETEADNFNRNKKTELAEQRKGADFALIVQSKNEAIEGRLCGMEQNEIAALLAKINHNHPEAFAAYLAGRSILSEIEQVNALVGSIQSAEPAPANVIEFPTTVN
jgi:hypothetical protein